MLNPLELTGRAATHVRDVPALKCRLHEAAVAAAFDLCESAAAVGIDLAVISSFRDFDRQVGIWNAKFRGERPLLDRQGVPLEVATLDESERIDAILLWSALPGASRHHWGTDMDVIDRAAVLPGYRPELTIAEFTGNGPFVRLNRWLAANLASHGFFRPYTTDRGGVHPEPWHLSYAPVATRALESLSVEVLADALEQSELLGLDLVMKRLPDIHRKYVMTIDRESPTGA